MERKPHLLDFDLCRLWGTFHVAAAACAEHGRWTVTEFRHVFSQSEGPCDKDGRRTSFGSSCPPVPSLISQFVHDGSFTWLEDYLSAII